MKAQYRLKKNYQYNYVFKNGKVVKDANLVLLYCFNTKVTRIGFSITKKYGNAVARNKLRRQLKAAFSGIYPQLKTGYNIVVVPKMQEELEFSVLSASVNSLLQKAGLLQ